MFSPHPYSKLFEEGYGEEHFSPKKFLSIIIPPPIHTKKKKRAVSCLHTQTAYRSQLISFNYPHCNA